jgi:hypothetical protein
MTAYGFSGAGGLILGLLLLPPIFGYAAAAWWGLLTGTVVTGGLIASTTG